MICNVKSRQKKPLLSSSNARASQLVSRMPREERNLHASSSSPRPINATFLLLFGPVRAYPGQPQTIIPASAANAVGEANCLIVSAHILLWGAVSVSCVLHPPSFRTFSRTFDCLTGRRTAELLHDVRNERPTHDSYTASKAPPLVRIATVRYGTVPLQRRSRRRRRGPIHPSHRPTRKTLQNIAKPTTIASNIPVHAQSLAPFDHSAACVNSFCPLKTTNKRRRNTK